MFVRAQLSRHCSARHAGYNRQLGLSDELFVLGDSAVLTVLGQVSFMPVLVLAARLCPEVRSPPKFLDAVVGSIDARTGPCLLRRLWGQICNTKIGSCWLTFIRPYVGGCDP